jgi:hypothetical protein
MKKIFFFLIFLTTIFNIYSQKGLTKKQWLNLSIPNIDLKSTQLSCNELTLLNSCNYIANNNFYTPVYDIFNPNHITHPFNLNLVTNWEASHGSANIYSPYTIYSNPLPPNNTSSFIRMASARDFSPDATNTNISEGVLQKIPNLTTLKKFQLSFFIRKFGFSSNISFNDNQIVENFKIVLLKCSDVLFPNPSFNSVVPNPLPSNHQVIYCEQNIDDINWKQVVINFIPNDNYDVIMIYPEQNLTGSNSFSNLLFSYPELVDITNFSAGQNFYPTLPNCNVTIGPSTPNNCSVINSVFRWIGPGGQIVYVTNPQVSQQITIDASLLINQGTWTLEMSVPTATITNNTCSNNTSIVQKSITVFPCSSDPCVNNQPQISPKGIVDYHFFYESGFHQIVNSNLPNGQLQWYVNNTPKSNETNSSILITNLDLILTPTNTYSCVVKAKNLQTGCFSEEVILNGFMYLLSNQSPLNYNGYHYLPVNTPSYYCNSTTNTINQFDLGILANYYWENDPVWPNNEFQIVPGSSSINSNSALINRISNNGSVFVGRAVLGNYQKVLQYSFWQGSTITTTSTCNNQVKDVLVPDVYPTNSGSANNVLAGMSGFDFEEYNFGPNCVITSPSNYAGMTGPVTITISGKQSSPSNLKVQFLGTNTFIDFYGYHQFGSLNSCFKNQLIINDNPYCKISNTKKISISPNPSTSTITLQNIALNSVVSIYTMNNTIVKTIKNTNKDSMQIDISDLKPGIYILKEQSNTDSQTIKFIKL